MSAVDASACVYVANSDSQDLSVFLLRGDGSLAATGTVAVQRPAVTGRSLVLTVRPDLAFLYAGYAMGGTHPAIATFALDPRSGFPTPLASTPIADSVAYIATDRDGKFLLGASYAGDKVMVSPIGVDGIVAPTRQVVASASKAHCIVIDPSNRHVLHTSLGGDLIYQHTFSDATGALSANDPPSVAVEHGAGPRFLCFARNLRFVYLICELDGSIRVFAFDASRGLLGACVQVASALPPGFTGKIWAADLHLTPDGRFLYACERTSSTLSGFAVDPASGLLTRISTVATTRQPRAFAIDPSGRFLACSGQLGNTLVVYAIDQENGRLNVLAEYPVGKNPTWVTMIPLAR
jgi:6-phosphogluconolactonase